MMYNGPKKLDDFTFSQREGLEPLPAFLKLGELSREVRNEFNYVIENAIVESVNYYDVQSSTIYWERIFADFHVRFLDAPFFQFNFSNCRHHVRVFIERDPYNKVIELLEFILNHKELKKSKNHLESDIREICERRKLAYFPFVTEKNRIIFIPVTSQEAREAYLKALNPVFNKIWGAREHLTEAGSKLVEGDFRGSIRESMHAVEATVRILHKDEGKLDFNRWLKDIAKERNLHPALVSAFNSLYGYTSDEEGIRHSHINENDVDQRLALCFLTLSSAFVTYLQS